MTRASEKTRRKIYARRLRLVVEPALPFDLGLSLAAMKSFAPPRADDDHDDPAAARRILVAKGRPVPAALRQRQGGAVVIEAAKIPDRAELRRAASRLLCADLDLRPFYRLARRHEVLGQIARQLRGLKPLRPPSLFEMAVTAITEQQISLAAAHHIRQRLIERFGERVEGLWAFPAPEILARAPLRALIACGLSRRKAEYIAEFARNVVRGRLDLAALDHLSDAEAREILCAQRGFGVWTADYILVRGLGRVDCVPADDLGVRDAIGAYLGRGRRVSAAGVARLLRPFAPYRGLAVFYLLVWRRLNRAAQGRATRSGELAPAAASLL